MNFWGSSNNEETNQELEDSQEEVNVIKRRQRRATMMPGHALIDSLYNNYNIFFDTLELGDAEAGCDYILLLRALCHNTTVRYVQIGSNFLSKFNPEEIRILLEVIGGMPKLESLKINCVPEMVLPAKAVANVLQRAPNLKELHFFDLELAGDEYEMEALGESLEALTSLKKVSFNQLGLEQAVEDGQGAVSPHQIVSGLSNLPQLEEVVLTSRRKFEWDDDSLGGLCESKTLKRLSLKNMDLSLSQVSSIAETLSTNTALLYLKLSDCGFDMEGWRSVASILPENTTLLHLDLSQCQTLDDDGCFIIGSCMEGNTALKILQLHNDESSEVSSKGISSLSRMLETNKTLETLEVSFTSSDDSGYKAIAEALQRNTTLKNLYLENHGKQVSTNGIVSLGYVLERTNKSLEQLAMMFDGSDNNGVLAMAKVMDDTSPAALKQFTFNRKKYIRSYEGQS